MPLGKICLSNRAKMGNIPHRGFLPKQVGHPVKESPKGPRIERVFLGRSAALRSKPAPGF